MKRVQPIIRAALLLVLGLFAAGNTCAQKERDKVSADQLLYEQLCENHTPSAPAKVAVESRELEKTYEYNLFRKKGEHYQINSLSSDFYVLKTQEGYKAVFDPKYPVESFVNLMLNHAASDKVRIAITQHMYGEKKTVPPIPLANLHELFGTTMDAYCSVTEIQGNVMKAILVFHHRKMDFIHMFNLSATPDELFSERAVIKCDLYGNIPQSNIKTLFKKYREQ